MTKKVPHRLAFIFTALIGLTLAAQTQVAQAGWRDQISNDDAQRLLHLQDWRAKALKEAEVSGAHGRGDPRVIHEILDPPAHGVTEQSLLGTWRCRQIKLGGVSDYAVFDWFTCRISRSHGGLWFQKEGTQRMAGYLYPEDGGMWIYLGAQSARGEPLHRYSGQGASVGGTVNPDDQAGALVGIGTNRLRLDLPAPATGESDFDSIELVR